MGEGRTYICIGFFGGKKGDFPNKVHFFLDVRLCPGWEFSAGIPFGKISQDSGGGEGGIPSPTPSGVKGGRGRQSLEKKWELMEEIMGEIMGKMGKKGGKQWEKYWGK